MKITSLTNPRVKAVSKLWASGRARREQQLFVVEGGREIMRALACGYRLTELFVQLRISDTEQRAKIMAEASRQGVAIFEITQTIYDKIAVREATDGVVAVMQMKSHHLVDTTIPAQPLILAAQAIVNPGNIGAMLRSADAVGVDVVWLLDYAGDIYNPHTIRASIGTVFSVPVVMTDTASFITYCQGATIKIYGAALHPKAQSALGTDFTEGCAIAVGTEATGIDGQLTAACDALIQLPMVGVADSLNVSIASAVLLYEAYRQRHQL